MVHPRYRQTHAVTIQAPPELGLRPDTGRAGIDQAAGARWRSDFRPTLAGLLVDRYALEPVHVVMERRMLLGIKRRAEEPSLGQPGAYRRWL